MSEKQTYQWSRLDGMLCLKKQTYQWSRLDGKLCLKSKHCSALV